MARMINKLPSLKMPRLPQVDPNVPDVFEEMTLQEHLEELTSRIKKICIGVGLAFIVGFILQGRIIHEIANKAKAEQGLQTLSPTDPIMLSFKVAMYVAFAIAFPLIIYQLVAFLAPGLTNREKRVLFSSLPFVSMLFIGGVAYGYFVAAPRALDFLSGWNASSTDWSPNGPETLNFFLTLMIGLGLAFQLPVVMFIVAKIGIFGPKLMRKYRKYAFLVIMILSAVITPSTDPFNMSLVAVPLVILYELGIVVSSVFAKTGLRQQAEAEAAQDSV